MNEITNVDISEPRIPVYQSFENTPGPCPKCGGSLCNSYQTYMVATRRDGRPCDSLIIGGPIGWFCRSCPVVVLDNDDIQEMIWNSKPSWDVGNEFALMGIVDLDAIPPDKRNVPLGEDDNPIPLVFFQHDEAHSGKAVHARLRRAKRKRIQAKLKKKRKQR